MNNFNTFWNDLSIQEQRIFNDQDLRIEQVSEFPATGVGIARNDNFGFMLPPLWCLQPAMEIPFRL